MEIVIKKTNKQGCNGYIYDVELSMDKIELFKILIEEATEQKVKIICPD